MTILLKLSQLIDALNRFVGKAVIWLILASTMISAINAVVRKIFHTSSNAYLEVQWYLFAWAFLLAAGVLTPGSDLLIRNIGVNPTRTGILDVLWAMGADVEIRRRHPQTACDPCHWIPLVRPSASLGAASQLPELFPQPHSNATASPAHERRRGIPLQPAWVVGPAPIAAAVHQSPTEERLAATCGRARSAAQH